MSITPRLSINDDYRLEITQHQPLSMTKVYVYQKHLFFFEKLITRPTFDKIIEQTTGLEGISVDDKNTQIQQANLINHNTQTLTLNYQINNKQAVMSHWICFQKDSKTTEGFFTDCAF